MKFEKQTFVDADVLLDGNEYIGCTFRSCRFIYSATGKFVLTEHSISADCRFVFRGAAADTLATMQAIYRINNWGRAQVLGTFQQLAPDLKMLN